MKGSAAALKWIGTRLASAGRMLCALLVAAQVSHAQETLGAGSAEIFLALGARAEADGSIEKARASRKAGIECVLLLRHGRLVPEALSPSAARQLVEAVLTSRSSAEDEALFATLPQADELHFDGRRYAGGNLEYIDSMLGKSGRPIAFDRELPALLVPLLPAAETTLVEQRAAFQADAGTAEARAHAERIYGPVAAAQMLADGQFLRAYAGRFDDLYFHLFQNGNGPSALAFCGLSEGLKDRAYRPLFGVLRREAAPAAACDLDDILSGGGKAAVRRYLQAQSARAGEPFQGFAFRVLPSLLRKAATLATGDRFTATHGEILRALKTRQHLYPTQVPPLYLSPDRFLGWTGSFFLPVANGPALPPGAADSWYPLPAAGGEAPADFAADGAASALLFESSSTPDIVWEDPQLSNLLGDSQPTPQGTAQPAESGPSHDPRRRAANVRWIAVVTPTNAEAREYTTEIRANDEKLREIEKARGRVRLLRQFIEGGRETFIDRREAEPGEPLVSRLHAAIEGDLAAYQRLESALAARLQTVLQDRADLRAKLENRLVIDRVRPLQAVGKKPGEPAAQTETALSL